MCLLVVPNTQFVFESVAYVSSFQIMTCALKKNFKRHNLENVTGNKCVSWLCLKQFVFESVAFVSSFQIMTHALKKTSSVTTWKM